ncbi:helix-turn-helix domain-containing protein [Pseudomonas gessardii]|uniref:helix-turn-helix domain-containing protein n=1 Tax=Pseudomonas gessardii TaxID=78544 RepID=UPI001FD4F7F7|nr:helix-turn-helix transcriptional regulator [Pseudomonas gessardii]
MRASSFLLRECKLELSKALGQALKESRISKGLSQEQVGASQSYVSDIERGLKTLSLEKLDEFASGIGVHPITILARCYLIKEESMKQEDVINRLRLELSLINQTKSE